MPLHAKSPNTHLGANTAGSAICYGKSRPTSPPSMPSHSNAVQSMLKTTTELANNGSFPPRSARLPRRQPQNIPTPRSVSTKTFASAASTHRPRFQSRDQSFTQLRSQSRRLERESSVQSAETGASRNFYRPYQSRRPRPFPLQQADSFGQSYHTLHSYRSQSTVGSYGDGRSLRSNSPWLSQRSKRFERSTSGLFPVPNSQSIRAQHRRSRSEASYAAVSVSPFHGKRPQLTFSRSARRPILPPSAIGQSYRRHGLYDLTSHGSSRRHGQSQRLYADSRFSLDAPSATTSDLNIPFYYDYSESFVEDGRRSDSLSSLPLEGGTTHDCKTQPPIRTAISPFGTMPGSRFAPVELATTHNNHASENTMNTDVKDKTRATPAAEICQQHAAVNNPDSHLHNTRPSVPHHTVTSSSKTPDTWPNPASKSVGITSTPHRGRGDNDIGTVSPRARMSPNSGTFFSNADRSPRNLAQLIARAHSPNSENERSQVNVASVFEDLKPNQSPPGERSSSRPGSSPDWKLPSLHFRPLSISMSSIRHPKTPPSRECPSPALIVSPCPERPVSSQSRKRFSKILDNDEIGSLIDSYRSQWPLNGHLVSQLETVQESASPGRMPHKYVPLHDAILRDLSLTIEDKGVGCLTEDLPTSSVPSHAKSTVGSLLDKHIQALGLSSSVHKTSVRSESHKDSKDIREHDSDALDGPLESTPGVERSSRPVTSTSQRPVSLTSSAHQRLVPKRLFAGQDAGGPVFPFMSDESGLPGDTSSTDESQRQSCGWPQRLLTGINKDIPVLSKPSLLSGELADIDTARDKKSHKFRDVSCVTLDSLSSNELEAQFSRIGQSYCPGIVKQTSHNAVLRRNSDQGSKSQVHQGSVDGKESCLNIRGTRGSKNVTVKDIPSQNFALPPRSPPLVSSTPNVLDSHQENGEQLRNCVNSTNTEHNQPKKWSTILTAMHLPSRNTADRKGACTMRTLRSHPSQASIITPLNTSRDALQNGGRAPHPKSSLPQLAQPDLGPTLNATQFDINFESKDGFLEQPIFQSNLSSSSGSTLQEPRNLPKPQRRFDKLRNFLCRKIQALSSRRYRKTVPKQREGGFLIIS